MNNRTIVILSAAMLLVLFLSGCIGEKISSTTHDNTVNVSTSNDNMENTANVSTSNDNNVENTTTSNDKSGETRIVNDSAGRQVQVPLKVERVADTWMGHNEVLAMLGADDRIVATMFSLKTRPWAYKVCPAYYNAVTLSPTYDVEALLATKPDVVFMPSRDKNIEKVSNLGVPVVEVNFTDFDSMKKCFSDTANVLGDEEALERSQKYNAYLDSKLESVRNISSKIPYKERPKVLHLVSLSPLCVDGGGNIISDWIEAAGGVNAAEEVKGGIMQEVSMEQVLKWNPDVIILSVNAKSEEKEQIMNSESWKKVKAVKNNRVYLNPEGAFIWSRAGAEEALQIQWAAKTINPDMFQSIDINNETKWFYKTFFDYELTDEDVQKILNAQAPD
ncbi:Iron(III) ABC transporter, solute-binding protein [Methanosarcina barkeri 3]|uniref:Iron(III) ABC transporter, solute-binding protein n=1 Tax=Methanosarcina barkeri 3 TaxID=1434107 RepID=A0A0E3WVU9_METBA|nr:ABC transporter substrate-binding protein [Methanosarcina barkeri]AKB81595.1 Iron(III) ABC transporter, solute-binding protein [Methanosarcina barkeri 3]